MCRCLTCKRQLVSDDEADGIDDPRIDCGGDCLWCVYEAEQGAPPEYRAAKPRGWPDDRHIADVVQAEALAAGTLKQIEGRSSVGALTLLPDATRSGQLGWMFFWDSVRHQTSGRVSDALAGNSPIVVLRTGSPEQFGTSPPAVATAEAAIG